MTMQKRLIILLICINTAIFFFSVSLLPQGGSYSFHNNFERIIAKYITSRYNWENVWTTLSASIILSVGIYFFVEGIYKKEEWE